MKTFLLFLAVLHLSQEHLRYGKGRPKKTSPTGVIRVYYSGEAEIDSGDMSREFLAEVVADIGREVFPQTLRTMFKMVTFVPVVRLWQFL